MAIAASRESDLYLKKFNYKENSLKEKIVKTNFSEKVKKIMDKLRSGIRMKHFAYSTERTYVDWSKRFFKYMLQKKNENILLDSIGSEDVKDFLSMLAVKQRVSASSQNQAFNAILFLFRNVLHKQIDDMDKTVRAKRGKKLPVVLSVEEIQQILGKLKGKSLLLVKLLYGTGMRLMELVRLRVQDLDFDSDLIFVRSGKGDKDRTTVFPEAIRDSLRLHLENVKNLHEEDIKNGNGEVYLPEALAKKYPKAAKEWKWQYVFPSSKLSVDPRSGKIRRHHISPNTVQKIVAKAVQESGITKQASVHTFRHSFATHLLMNGVNIREIQDLLGHEHVETTMIYTHVLRDMANALRSPLDVLYGE